MLFFSFYIFTKFYKYNGEGSNGEFKEGFIFPQKGGEVELKATCRCANDVGKDQVQVADNRPVEDPAQRRDRPKGNEQPRGEHQRITYPQNFFL